MAKRIVDEEMRFSIIINGNEAQKELYDLEKSTRDLTQRNKELKAARAQLYKEGKRGSAQYKKLSQEIKANDNALTKNKNKMKGLQDQIGLTGLTMKQLRSRSARLRIQLDNLIPGSAKHKKLQADLKKTSARMTELKTKSRGASRGIGSLADKFNRYAALGASVIATLTGVIFSLQQMIDYNGKLSDAQADVMKTTGMTKDEVDDLAKSFGLLQTRTARINLLKIAEEGGRIGIVKEEIGEFVEVMNKATVALSDSFPGGVEEVASKLGKLKLLFKETKEIGVDEAYNAIGSAINDLGADGVATEANIAAFATRVGSLPDAVKPSISQALALGAAFEESGVMAEIAGRGYNIALKAAAENSDKFGKVMGITTKEVEDLINADPLEFMIKFSKGMKGMNATDTAKTLKFLGLNADGTNKIIGALSNNTELFRSRLELSTQSMQDATSLTDEYDIKNNNLAATIEKVSKRFRGLFTSDMVVSFLSTATTWFGKFIGAVDDSTGGVTRFRDALYFFVKILAIITAATLSYNAAVKLTAIFTNNAYRATKLYELAQKVSAITTNVLTAATLLGKAAFYALTGQIQKARAALRLLNMTTSVSPWGALFAIVAAATVAYIAFSEEAKKAATKQSYLNDAIAEGQKKTTGITEKLKVLQGVAEDTTASEEARKKAMEQINKIVPDYNKNLDLSQEALNNGRKAIDKYVESLQKQAEAQFLADQVSIKSKELMETKNANISKHIEWYEQLWNSVKSLGNAYQYQNNNLKTMLENRQKSMDLTKKELEAAKKAYGEYLKMNPDSMVTEDEYVSTFTPVGDGSGDGSNNSQKLYDLEKEHQEYMRVRRANDQAKSELIAVEYKRELEQLEIQHQGKMDQLEANLIKEKELEQLQKQADVARDGGDNETADNFEAVIAIWRKKNDALKAQMKSEEMVYQLETGKIIENGQEQQVDSLQHKYSRESNIRQTAFNNQLNDITSLAQAKAALQESLTGEELASITSIEQAKEALRKQFQIKELEEQAKHLQALVSQMEAMYDSGEFEGMDLDLLPEEQKQEMLQRLEELKLALSEVAAAKAKITASDDDDSILKDGGDQVSDLFGMTADDWGRMFENLKEGEELISTMANAVHVLSSTWKAYSDYKTAAENKEFQDFENKIESRKQKQQRLLDQNLINQRQYDRAVAELEKEKERKKAELEYKQAKRNKAISITEAVISTSLAIMQAFSQLGPIAGAVAAAFMATTGALQIATIAKQPLPARGYEDGLYPVEREQDGKMFNARYGGTSRSGVVDQPTLFLAGEQGKDAPEMIINGADYSSFTPEFRDSLHNELARVKGYQDGFYPTATKQPEFSKENGTNQQSDSSQELAVAIKGITEMLEYLKENPMQAYLAKNQRMAKEMQEEIEKYNQTRNNARQ